MANRNFPESTWGITAPQYRHPSQPRTNLDINSKEDDKPVRINSREYSKATGSQIGVQIKPNIVADNTSEHTGLEVSPRLTDAAGSLLGLNVAPLLKTATGARAVATMKCVELNPGLPGSGSAYTVTALDGIRVFLDTGVGHTITTKSIIRIAAPNNADWDFLLNAETGTSGWVVVGAGTYSTADGYFLVKVGASTYRVPFFAGTD